MPGLRAFAVLVCCVVLAACVSSGPAPVTDRGVADPPRSGYHRVREGETLYAIAWRYGVDWDVLAKRNRIAAPYTIFPGQRLRILAEASESAARAPATVATTPSAEPPRSGPVATPPPRRTPAPTPRAPAGPIVWSWPVEGEVVQGYRLDGTSINKGIDIRGAPGAHVRAAARGQVVYAGTGLRGHSRLVIVKHDDTWLSAYAHDDEILVSEGQVIAAGERLARLAEREDAERTLHFEIRQQGKPVDPTRLLPSR